MPRKTEADDSYLSWSDEPGRERALASAAQSVLNLPPSRAQANTYQGWGPNGESIRDGFDRSDYENFRPREKLPTGHKEVMRACMGAYDNVGIVRNVIDLMSDFACQGLDLVHHNARTEAFYKEWFRRCDGPERSERFLNLLYRCGNVIVKRMFSELPVKAIDSFRNSTSRAKLTQDIPYDDGVDPGTRMYPSRYVFLNPLTVEVYGEQIATFIGKDGFVYYVNVPADISRPIITPGDDVERSMVNSLPADLRKAIKSGQKKILLDPDRLYVAFYKRDDWRTWATPMLRPMLRDLQMLEKLKVADVAALDGVISSIRVWKLGSLEHKIIPPESLFLRLARTLSGNVGGGVMDVVWGPDLELLETSTDAHNFLGEEKYKPVLASIFQGLGIPPTLSGTSSAGYTNNYMSMKTLVERLEYGRTVLAMFWENEIRLVQKAMGFRHPAKVSFDKLLTDEAAEKQLLLNLWDRHLVSDEAVREAFGRDPDIEEWRIRREEKKRESGVNPPKASPYHDPQQDYGLKKIYAQTGEATPKQVGLDLEHDSEDPPAVRQEKQAEKQANKQQKVAVQTQQSQMDHEHRTNRLLLQHNAHPNQIAPGQPQPGQKRAPTGVSGQGRPKLSKDTQPRKQKTVKPRTGTAALAHLVCWADQAQASVHRALTPHVLESLGRKTLRELTDEEARAFESLKLGLLFNLPPEEPFADQDVVAMLDDPAPLPLTVANSLKEFAAEASAETGKPPTLDESRRMQSAHYALWHGLDADLEDADEPEPTGPLVLA